VLARLHFLVRVEPGHRVEVELDEVERRVAAATRSWADDLAEALIDRHGEERGRRLFATWGEAFPAAYREDHPARLGAADLDRLRELSAGDDLAMSLYRPVEAPEDRVRFKLYRHGAPVTLSEVLPLLEHMGLEVIDQRPYGIVPAEGASVWIHDFGLSTPPPGPLADERTSRAFQDAFAHVWRGVSEDDGFNRLVLRAGLDWRDVTLLRAYSKYLRQAATRFSQAYMEDALVDNPEVARLLVGLFHARFDPQRREDDAALEARGQAVVDALDEVSSLDEDRILRSFLHLIQATLRTNHFRGGGGADGPGHLSFKWTRSGSPPCRSPARPSRSSSTRPGSRACTCAAARSRAAGCGGRTAARTSAPRSSGWPRPRRSRTP
jgi:glutamate dehydrogenase